MQWNELSYEMQQKVYDRIEKALLQEADIEVQDAIVAAMNELEHWDNSPCSVVEEDGIVTAPMSMSVEAQDVKPCCDCAIPWFCKCLCHDK